MASFNKRASSRPLRCWDLTSIVEAQGSGEKAVLRKGCEEGLKLRMSVYCMFTHDHPGGPSHAKNH
jgi:hypothetical protein